MSDKIKSFILHNDSLNILDDLTDEQAGLLFKAIRNYQNDEVLDLDTLTKVAFSPFKNQFERDEETSRSGENHWNWKGGISTENQRLRNSSEYKSWRASVFERDEHTCQICNLVGGNLNAHHIKEWAKYPNARFDVDNGLTLCKPCHIEVHREN